MSIPSFSSFTPAPESLQPSGSQNLHGQSHIKKENKRKKEDKSRRRKHEAREPREPSSFYQRITSETSGNSPMSWFSDVTGDHLNTHYGVLHSYTIPKYYLAGRGSVIGLPKACRTTRRSTSSIEINSYSHHAHDNSATRFTTALKAPKHKLVPTSSSATGHQPFMFEEDIILLRDLKSHPEAHSSKSMLLDTVHHEGIADSDVESGYSTDTDSGSDSIKLTAEQSMLKEMEMKLAENPNSTVGWISILHHALRSIPITSKCSATARAKIATSILKRGLEASPLNRHSSILWIAYLKWGEEVLPPSKLDSEWAVALHEVQSETIWMEWLSWRLRNSKKSGLNGFLEDAQRCLGASQSDELKLVTLWHVAVALQGAGHSERAVALMQAQCELSLHKPLGVEKKAFSEQLHMLGQFWESEAPRLGENNALGWSAWAKAPRKASVQEPTAPKSQTRTFPPSQSDPYTHWVLDERVTERHMPTRASGSDSSGDVYSTVMFEDIQYLLVDLREKDSVKTLKRIWLSIMGLHIPGLCRILYRSASSLDGEIEEYWSRTQLCKHDVFNTLFPDRNAVRRQPAWEAYAGVVIGSELHNSGFGPIKEWGYGALDPLEFVNEAPQFRLWEPSDVVGVDVPVVRLIFQNLRQESDIQWDCLFLAFEMALNITGAIHLSRSFLASHRDSLLHWHWHAQLERNRGDVSKARKLYETVLSSLEGCTLRSSHVYLWWSYAELEWLSGRPDVCISLVCRACGFSGGSSNILRAKQRLEEELSINSDAADIQYGRAILRLRVLLELLTTSLELSLQIFDSNAAKVTPGDLAAIGEQLLCDNLLMLHHHVSTLKNICRRSLVRERVASAASSYPDNTFILALFLEVEKGEAMWGRVRHSLGSNQTVLSYSSLRSAYSTMPKIRSLGHMVWEIWVAAQWLGAGQFTNEVSLIRHLFSSCETDPMLHDSAVLWRLYVEFETRVGALDRAKRLLILAISYCPLNKELYLLAFGPLRSTFMPRELIDLVDLMMARGIRLRKELEHYQQNWTEDREMPVVDEERDEVEQSADEYRRLLPY